MNMFSHMSVMWLFYDSQVECEQVPVWLPPCELPVLTDEDMDKWMSIGEVREREREKELKMFSLQRKLTIDDETLYCDEAVLDRILKGKVIMT